MRARAWFAVLGVALGAAPLAAQQPTFRDTLLDKFVGEWTLQGMMRGKETTHDVSVEWVIAHQYLRIHEVSRDLNADGSPTYEATVYVAWDGTARQYTCVWLDVYGSITDESIGRAPAGGKEIAFVFKYHDGSSFHTTFAPGPTLDTWTWRMDNENATGVRKPFARVTLTRKPPPVPTR